MQGIFQSKMQYQEDLQQFLRISFREDTRKTKDTSKRGRPGAARTLCSMISKFYGDGFGRDVISADSSKIEGIEGNSPIRRF